MAAFIFQLPNELMFAIVQQLDIVDAFQITRTCHRFRVIIYNYSMCRALVEAQAPYSPECRELRPSQQYMRAFCLLAKRKLAIANLEPFAAAVIAVADSHLYVNGTLLYINDRTLRILSLRGIVRQELVINIRKLLDQAIEESKGTDKYKFVLLHFANGIVTCRYTHCRTVNETWLVVFSIHEHWAHSVRVPSPFKIFARSNKDYVVYGTHTGQGDDGLRRWVLKCFSLRTKMVVGKSIYLRKIIGADIGLDICFDIVDGYFYALSNQSAAIFHSEATDSYYACYRFRLADMDEGRDMEAGGLQGATTASLWRRSNMEGTIDDRWTFLRLEKDEKTGAMCAVEARKEWRLGSGDSRRTYYSQELHFSPDAHATTVDDWGHVYGTDCMGASHQSLVRRPRRLPQQVHLGDDSADMIPLRPSDCFLRSYHTTCSTFLDLVHIPTASKPAARRLCLRSGSRRLKAPMSVPGVADLGSDAHNDDNANDDANDDDDERIYPIRAMRQLYHTIQPQTWPRATEHPTEDQLTGQIEAIMNPPSHNGDVSGVWDECSLLYAVDKNSSSGGEKLPRALVFVSFDPAIRLGLQRVRPEDSASTSNSAGPMIPASPRDWMDQFLHLPDDPAPEELLCPWMSAGAPMYRVMDAGFDFHI